MNGQPFSIIAPAEVIRELLCGPQQHNEHCKGWRWHLYMQDTQRRAAAVREAELAIIARARRTEVDDQSEAA